MTPQTQPAIVFDEEQFRRSQSGLSRIKSSLPRENVELLAREVLNRLSGRVQEAGPQATSLANQVTWLARALISADPQPATGFIRALREKGMDIESVYLTYLAGAARQLGAWWDEDKLPFTDVTLGAGRIYAIMRGLRPGFVPASLNFGKTAAFASVPGETHTLGVSMAADLFRKNGWDVSLQVDLDHDGLVDALATNAHTVIGLSCGGRHSVVALTRLIVALRICAPHAMILVSGRVVQEAPDMVALAEPDVIAADIEEARAEMNRFEKRLAGDLI